MSKNKSVSDSLIKININGDFIRLDNLLKFSGLAQTGGQAKVIVQSGQVKVNGQICTMRGKKIRKGDTAQFEDKIVEVE